MAIYKCKMCGGTLEVSGESSVATCEYCSSVQTLPKKNDEVITNLFNRANNLRIKCEFDKAADVYEKILNEDNKDSEAHWGLVLCKYGIEYVEDPKTYKRIPTCHRTQYESILTDVDYLAAISNADSVSADIYKAQAEEIANLQKDILAIVKNEKPFDVFICYKETDENGKRTVDSTLANDIFYQLTQEGMKVFYAAITLEDKLGVEYEPYIFAALNSAKVMLVVGTKPEYFEAIWVKNEWSRYLKLMKEDRSKLLIPCYRDMDAYDLPEEFSHLQAQDMGKIGFVNDVVRGIKKIITSTESKTETVVKETVVTSSNTSTAPLLKRVFMFLEDGDWKSADEYCEKVLDLDPECAEAYLGKLMAEQKVKTCESLKDKPESFFGSNNYQKAVRFGDDKLKKMLSDSIEHINTRNENIRLDSIYRRAKKAMSDATTDVDFNEAERLFKSIIEYSDSSSLAEKCIEKAEESRKDAILSKAKEEMKYLLSDYYEAAAKHLKSISGWKDADELLAECEKTLAEIKAKAEAERLEKERKAEIARKEAERKAKRNKKIAIITTPIVCAIIAFIIVLNTVIIPNGKYNDAIAAGKYTEAISAFEALDGYKDSATKITKCNTAILDGKYNDAIALMDAGKYTEAISAFEALDGYKDSATKITECKYNDAVSLMENKNYEEAITAFEELGDYNDSKNKIDECYIGIYGKEAWDIIQNTNIGDTYILGDYYDGSTGTRRHISWDVIDKKGSRILVISSSILDCIKYDSRLVKTDWSNCTLRTWLNGTFYANAFYNKEKSMISSTTLSAHKNPLYNTDQGNATQDKIFVLSAEEVEKYLQNKNDRICYAANYTLYYGINEWWLRTTGGDQVHAAYVDEDGDISYYGTSVANGRCGVRPAMWIDLSKI